MFLCYREKHSEIKESSIEHHTVPTLDDDFDDITDSLIAAMPEDHWIDSEVDSELNDINKEYLDRELPDSMFEAVTDELLHLSSSFSDTTASSFQKNMRNFIQFLLSNKKFQKQFCAINITPISSSFENHVKVDDGKSQQSQLNLFFYGVQPVHG